MAEALFISEDVVVPSDAMEVRAVRSSGPGGQNVNKVSTKIVIRLEVSRIQGMDAESRRRLGRLAGRRVDRAGILTVSSQRTRDQHRNLQDARDKIRNLILASLTPVKDRVPTRPARAALERRLEKKRRKSRRKKLRQRVREREYSDPSA